MGRVDTSNEYILIKSIPSREFFPGGNLKLLNHVRLQSILEGNQSWANSYSPNSSRFHNFQILLLARKISYISKFEGQFKGFDELTFLFLPSQISRYVYVTLSSRTKGDSWSRIPSPDPRHRVMPRFELNLLTAGITFSPKKFTFRLSYSRFCFRGTAKLFRPRVAVHSDFLLRNFPLLLFPPLLSRKTETYSCAKKFSRRWILRFADQGKNISLRRSRKKADI